jgi:uncharacterized YccA/Bax inhibitor family protein
MDAVVLVVASIMTILGTVVTTVIANPILLIGVAGGLVGTAIAIFKKMK